VRRRLCTVAVATVAALAGCASGRSAAHLAAPSASSSPSATSTPSETPSPAPSDSVPTTSPTATASPPGAAARPSGPVHETPAPLPSAVTAPGAGTLPMCQAGSLSALLTTVSAGSGGDQAAFVEFRNEAATACRLEGQPTVRMLAPSGASLPTTLHAVALYRTAPVALQAHSVPIRPGTLNEGHAYLAVVFNAARDQQAHLCNPPEVTTPSSLAITLPGGAGTLTVSATAGDGSGKHVQACHGELGVSVYASRGTAATQ
jgi:hypothetical protein